MYLRGNGARLLLEEVPWKGEHCSSELSEQSWKATFLLGGPDKVAGQCIIYVEILWAVQITGAQFQGLSTLGAQSLFRTLKIWR